MHSFDKIIIPGEISYRLPDIITSMYGFAGVYFIVYKLYSISRTAQAMFAYLMILTLLMIEYD